ncbi:TonB-dependent hemoglobin/transferrin/lactoferrin family receptor [Bartonella sp. HY406]|uniref:TonB-dependent hemoglobin/transferrin/lactoferrin family receptor n=1 Tax=Bartonella sp. HY406 TaxID=2979331 RepID=UPI0021C911C1|nr:TonB-dependent hemoglobin/transferrin/lactoferrin family receptor [Bartonella sp. HY406]UXN02458.1 TonB-dependent hemoglobin/transferrin/lactoferrin family receptor [Bartonella sp. HY406]
MKSLTFSKKHFLRFYGLLLLSTSIIGVGTLNAQHVSVLQDNNQELPSASMLEPVVIISTREEKTILDIPQTISVVTRQQMDDHMINDIQDLVRHQPGVSVSRQTSITNPWGQLTGFTIRGVSGNRVQLTVDGSRIQESITDGSRDFFDLGNFQAVEIVKGPNSVLWGADALGGAVMFRTRDPSDLLKFTNKPWVVELKTGYDSFDRSWKKQVTGAYDFGDLQILGSYNQVSLHEPRLRKARADGGIWGCTRRQIGCNVLFPADTDVDNLLVKAVWSPTKDHTFKLTGELFGRDTEILQLYDLGESATGRPSVTSYINDSYIRDLDMKRRRIAFEHQWNVDKNWLDSIKWRVSYSPQSRETDSLQKRIYSNRYHLVNQYRKYSETFAEADIQLQSNFNLAGAAHLLTYGFDGDTTKGNYKGTNQTFNSLTGLTVTQTNQGFSFPKVDTQRADIYLQDEISLLEGRLIVTPGLRLAHYEIDPTGDKNYPGLPGYAPQEHKKSELIKRLGGIFHFDETYSAYASYGEGFKMPTSQQLFQSSNDPFSGSSIIPNANLKPEYVKNYEIGLRGSYNKGYFSFGTFYADYTDFIRSFQQVMITAPDGSRVPAYTFDNVSKVHLWGIEFAGEYEVFDYTTISANISWSKGRQKVDRDAERTAFDGAVPITAVLGVKHRLADYNLEFEALTTLAAGRKENANESDFLPSSYALFDVYAKWTPHDNFELSAGVENIFDRRYFPNTLTGYTKTPASAAVANVNPLELQTGPGRLFKLGATVRF